MIHVVGVCAIYRYIIYIYRVTLEEDGWSSEDGFFTPGSCHSLGSQQPTTTGRRCCVDLSVNISHSDRRVLPVASLLNVRPMILLTFLLSPLSTRIPEDLQSKVLDFYGNLYIVISESSALFAHLAAMNGVSSITTDCRSVFFPKSCWGFVAPTTNRG